jgi:hypothetical protein
MKVHVGKTYKFQPVMFDVLNPCQATAGQLVKVVNLHGCPKANTMGMCYIATVEDGAFLGMVMTSSLIAC